MFHRAGGFLLALLALQCSDAEGAPDDLTAACRRLAECGAALGEAETERACADRLAAEYDEASTAGCAAEYADWVACLATTRGQCGEAEPCQAQQDTWSACQPPAAEP